MKKLFNRRGELTTQQIVLIIILIVSFVIILFLLWRLNLGQSTDAEVCHNSVVMRGSAALPSDSVTLNCKTEYVCITEDGSCEGLVNPRKVKVGNVNEIYSELSTEMVNCFWMYGERKVDYIGTKIMKDNYCSICSQIYFDDSLKNIKELNESISKDELFNYLAHTKVPDKDYSYLEYLAGTNDVVALKKSALESAGQKGEGTFGKIEIGKQYFMVTGITSEISLGWKVAGGIVGVVGVVAGVVSGSFVVGAIVVGAGVLVAGVGEIKGEPEVLSLVVKGDGVDNKFMLPTIVEANSDKFKALDCEDVLSYS